MYRMTKFFPLAGTACALALTLACNSAPANPTTPGATGAGDAGAAADGSTLKAAAPTAVSPRGDERLTNRRPTLVIANSTGSFVNRGFSYEFQMLTDSGAVVSSATLGGGNGSTTWNYPADLDRDTAYRWQARAVLGSTAGPWSTPARFFTVKENRAADPPAGQRLPIPSYAATVIFQVAAQRPDLLGRSCQEHNGTWEFMDLVIDTLRAIDTRWGYNWKRGIVGDPSLDVINYHNDGGPDEGARSNYTFDIILGHCGSPTPAFIDITNPNGAGSMWTGRGRF